jgi:hypothetical protein
MRKWSVALVALLLASPVTMHPAAAASSKPGVISTDGSEATTLNTTDLGARRRYRHYHRYAQRPSYQAYYYDRPIYYRPYPYVAPVPFFLGFGYGPGYW